MIKKEIMEITITLLCQFLYSLPEALYKSTYYYYRQTIYPEHFYSYLGANLLQNM